MRNSIILPIFTILQVVFLTAQSPSLMSYQAVIWDAAGNLVVEKDVNIRLSILQGSATGPAVYVETHRQRTNANGLVSLLIGGGNNVSGKMVDIQWGAGNYFLKTETDPSGGTNYSITGTTQLVSVPYAMYAKTAESILFQKLTDLDDAHSGGVDFQNSIQIGNPGPYPYTRAYGNTGVGIGIFDSLSAGFNNSTFGFESLKYNTIGNNNVAMGYRALHENNEGSYNVAIGAYSLEKNKVFVRGALGGPGFQNVAIGSWALQHAISNGNVAVGTDVLRNLTIGGQNTGMGEHAMRDLILGNGNISIGYASMISSAPGVSSNTVVGTRAGGQNKGSNNILIGYGSGTWNKGSGNILIGNNSGWDSIFHNQSNILIIENSGSSIPLFFGDFEKKRVRINNTLSVASMLGIGVIVPERPLHISDVMRLEPKATAPDNPSKGDIYMDDKTNKLRVFDGTKWQDCW